ncbi:MAG: CoA transferase [Chloroflexi bacterium]|nr:CoA transferase [Chloroflexota bacterium]
MRGFRALDLTHAEAGSCGKLLADLGVHVVEVEPPGGDVSPRRGHSSGACPDQGIRWLAFNVNKRSITLDLTRDVGRDVFLR